eukprot:3588335-Amphidinium_carterae.1
MPDPHSRHCGSCAMPRWWSLSCVHGAQATWAQSEYSLSGQGWSLRASRCSSSQCRVMASPFRLWVKWRSLHLLLAWTACLLTKLGDRKR